MLVLAHVECLAWAQQPPISINNWPDGCSCLDHLLKDKKNCLVVDHWVVFQ
jgi:hypothetical protein